MAWTVGREMVRHGRQRDGHALARTVGPQRAQPAPAGADVSWLGLGPSARIDQARMKRVFTGGATVIDSARGFCANYHVQSYFGLPFCASVFGCLRRSKDPVVCSIGDLARCVDGEVRSHGYRDSQVV